MKSNSLASLALLAGAVCLSVAAPLAGAADTIYEDFFNRSNTSAGSADPLGTNWLVSGDAFINSNQVAVQPNSPASAIYLPATVTETGFAASVNLMAIASRSQLHSGFIFNYDQQTGKGLAIRLTDVGSATGIQLLAYDNGTISLISQSALGVTLAAGTYYTFSLSSTETDYTYAYKVLTTSGTSLASGSMTDSTGVALGGKVGLFFGVPYVRADDFSLAVPQIPESGTSALLLGGVALSGLLLLRRRCR